MMRELANTNAGRAMHAHYRCSEGDVVAPKRPSTCECPDAPEGIPPIHFFHDPHPKGWCRSCGRTARREAPRG